MKNCKEKSKKGSAEVNAADEKLRLSVLEAMELDDARLKEEMEKAGPHVFSEEFERKMEELMRVKEPETGEEMLKACIMEVMEKKEDELEEEIDNMVYFQEIKNAILNKEFVLYFQPIVNLKDKTMEGAEALMRWNHPTKGVQAPSTFLKVLEQSGDIKWVGEWGIESMIRMHNQMAEKFPTIPMRFSLNLSTKQLLDPTLATKFIDIMNKNNAKPDQYMLEISDFMMVERIAVIKTNIYKLRDFGFKIAVDGFELDGQSVQNIQRSPIDVIKLGRGFLKDIENNFMKERFLQILVKYAMDNNRQLICEGIETAEVTKYVKEQNVFYGQGYYFAKPMSQEAFAEYLEKHQYKVLLDDVSSLEDSEALFKDQDMTPEEEHEETPEELLERIARGEDIGES